MFVAFCECTEVSAWHTPIFNRFCLFCSLPRLAEMGGETFDSHARQYKSLHCFMKSVYFLSPTISISYDILEKKRENKQTKYSQKQPTKTTNPLSSS